MIGCCPLTLDVLFFNPFQRDYAPDYSSIPPHGRWQHFDVGGRPRINQLLQSWPSTIDVQERTRRLIDLFLISVLLDAGAGNQWSYKSKESGKVYARSEGLAVASLEMFKSGLFSSDPTEPCQVDGAGLKRITPDMLGRGMQHSEKNPLAGIEGRAGLLVRLSEALNNQELFGVDARPGNMLGRLDPIQPLEDNPPLTRVLRLLDFPSFDPCVFCAYCVCPNSVVCPYGWPCSDLAGQSNAG